MEKATQHLHAIRRVHYFRVKLHSPNSTLGTFHGRHRRIGRGRSCDKADWSLNDSIEVAHPHVLLHRQVGKQLTFRVGHGEPGPTVFAAHTATDLATLELLRDQLHSVTDTQNGNAEVIDRRIKRRCTIDMHTLGATRQNDRRRLTPNDLLGSDSVGHYLAVYVELANTPRNELRVLGSEVNDEDGIDTVGQDIESSPRWAKRPRTRDDVPMRRWIVLTLIATALFVPTHAFAVAPPNSGEPSDSAVTTTSLNNDFLNTKRDLSQCLGHSVDLPDCGIEPTHPGDRGGALQYTTFGLMILGVAFIFWRVARGIKARDAALGTRPS